MATFKIEVDDDEAMPELLEQCAGARVPPSDFLSAMVNDALRHAADENLKLVVPGQTENTDLH